MTTAEAKADINQWIMLLATRSAPRGYHYSGMGDFLKQHGIWYETEPYRVYDIPLGAPKMCFGNAILTAATHGLRYVEGLAVAPKLFSFHHAWNLDANGKVIDTTWANKGVAYFGVEFSVERADDATWNGDASVLNDFNRRHPLFRNPWNGEDYNIKWPESERLLELRAGRAWQLLDRLSKDAGL